MGEEAYGSDLPGSPDSRDRASEINSQRDSGIHLTNSSERGQVEGNDRGQRGRTGAVDLGQHLGLNAGVNIPASLDFDEGQIFPLAKPGQGFREFWNSQADVMRASSGRMPPVKPGACVEPLEDCKAVFRDPPTSGSGPIKSGVVDDDWHSIRRQVNVKFDSLGALARR